MFHFAGLIEYLLDRNEEGGMNCKATKYNLVKSIIETPFAGNVFNSDVMDKFNAHVRQGVCYVQTRTVVAMEAEWRRNIFFNHFHNFIVLFSN